MPARCPRGVQEAVHDAVASTVRLGVATTADVAQIVVDGTVGRLLDTDPERMH